MRRTYEIQSGPANLGGGWYLKLLEDGRDAGGSAFPLPEEAPQASISWWNTLREERRAHWLMMAASAMPAAARRAYLLSVAYNDALIRVSHGRTHSCLHYKWGRKPICMSLQP